LLIIASCALASAVGSLQAALDLN